MRSADFEGADFTGATLQDMDLGRARLHWVLLFGADLRAIDFAEADLTEAIADETTIGRMASILSLIV